MKRAVLNFLSVPMIMSALPATSFGVSEHQEAANKMIIQIVDNDSFDENVNLVRIASHNEITILKNQQLDLRNSLVQIERNGLNKTDKVKSLLYAVMVDVNKEIERAQAMINHLSSGKSESFLLNVQKEANKYKANPNIVSKENQELIYSHMCEKDKSCIEAYKRLIGQKPIVNELDLNRPTLWYRLSDYGITKLDDNSDKTNSCSYGSPLSAVGHTALLNARNVETLDRIVQRGVLTILCKESRFRGPWAKYSESKHTVSYMINMDYGSVTISHYPEQKIFELFQ